MSKEEWILSYESAVEDLVILDGIDYSEAEDKLNRILEKDTGFLNGYITIVEVYQ